MFTGYDTGYDVVHYRPGEAPALKTYWTSRKEKSLRDSQMLCWRGLSVSLTRFSPSTLARPLTSRGIVSMSTIPPSPTFQPFNLALIQLGQIGTDKRVNLKHAREMIRRAAKGEGAGGAHEKPDLIVLPVSASCSCPRTPPSEECPSSTAAGMLQLALWPRIFPALCRDYWV